MDGRSGGAAVEGLLARMRRTFGYHLHLHGLDVVNRIDSNRQLRYVKGAVTSGSGDLSSITISEVLRSNTIKRATCFGRI